MTGMEGILHIDDRILVVEKPAGLPVLPDGWEPEAPYLVNLLEAEYGKVWVVHRLDKVTSGEMVPKLQASHAPRTASSAWTPALPTSPLPCRFRWSACTVAPIPS